MDTRHNTPASTSRNANNNNNEMTEDEGAGTPTAAAAKPPSRRARASALYTNLNPAIYVGNKVKHLKKEDSEPLWRSDIQYDFLKAVFEDNRKVFTNSYEPDKSPQTFADLYIDTMARSSKTSKILRDKLLSDHEPAKNMAMVCLLVNLGRMNTTLNFFPEMRAQLRTYHPIPSLQAHQDPNSYKQLQDAPRLKSILKGATEDRPEPQNIEKIKQVKAAPRTNPVNLIFVLAQFAPKVTELHFPPPRDFYDLLMRPQLSSASRARAFLWLMWHYLESDFTEQGAEENPFGPGVDYGTEVANQGVPELVALSEEEVARENVDPPAEIQYGESKAKERKRIIEADQAAAAAAAFSQDHSRSTPPPRTLAASGRLGNPGTAAGPGARKGGPLRSVVDLTSSPVSSGATGPPHPLVVVQDSPAVVARRQRPLTAHQLAVEANRSQRVEHILGHGLRKAHHVARKARRRDGAIWRALCRARHCVDPSEDSEADEAPAKAAPPPLPFRERGFVGLVQLDTEEEDYGEEMAAYAAALRRMGRRLDRWEGHRGPGLGVIGTGRPLQVVRTNGHARVAGDDSEDERVGGRRGGAQERGARGDGADEDDLDDIDKELLGLGSDDEAEEDLLDDADKGLLRDDETEDETGMDLD